ncbi:GntR family transcriptional regulator [Streptomyces sp. NPDC048696]|uniref:GntR family transcriptional regulator n=1 Tax=Streptomyces sp. NPDC048696 TaxID=3365585 RepID=UPI00371D3F11
MATERPGAQEGEVPQGGKWTAKKIAGELRSRINRGVRGYELGQRLPTHNELANEFSVSLSTVQGAMDELKSEGWIESRQGSQAKVLRAQQVYTPPAPDGRSAPEGFQSILANAFTAQEVTLDAFCLTTESLADHLGVLARGLAGQRTRDEAGVPRSIAMRLLLPAADPKPVFPSAADDPDDSRPYERWAAMVDLHILRLRRTLDALRRGGFVSEVRIEVRRVPVTPAFKLYLFNKVTVLQGYYMVEQREMLLDDDERVQALDVLGLQSRLFRYEKSVDTESQGSLLVEAAQKWFDSWWEHIGVASGPAAKRSAAPSPPPPAPR